MKRHPREIEKVIERRNEALVMLGADSCYACKRPISPDDHRGIMKPVNTAVNVPDGVQREVRWFRFCDDCRGTVSDPVNRVESW